MLSNSRLKNIASSIEEIQSRARGEKTKGREYYIAPPEVDVRLIRMGRHMSQEEFANHYGFPLGTVRNWEQGRRHPEGAARILLSMIDKKPELVEEFLGEYATNR